MAERSNCDHKSLASFAQVTLHQVQQELLESHLLLLRGGLNYFFENNEVSNPAIPGWPRISTREEDAILVREAENHIFYVPLN